MESDEEPRRFDRFTSERNVVLDRASSSWQSGRDRVRRRDEGRRHSRRVYEHPRQRR